MAVQATNSVGGNDSCIVIILDIILRSIIKEDLIYLPEFLQSYLWSIHRSYRHFQT